ncbi:hypothetical protein DXG01_007767 [Tephrocybe rancida]|nr:hypothetical protein DXG01_007767 [Tephrocybe rancida]
MEVRNASHENLIQPGNPAYGKIWLQNVALNAELKGVKTSFEQLLARMPKHDGVAMANGGLGGGITSELAVISGQRAPLMREDYPLVKFWIEEDWLNVDQPKMKKASKAGFHQVQMSRKQPNPNSNRETMAYIQDQFGNTITVKHASDLTARAQSIWEYLRTQGLAPSRWGKVSAPALEYYLLNIYRGFDELQLCEGDWKATRLATVNYPGWARNNLKLDSGSVPKGPVIKSEPGPVEGEELSNPTCLSKRKVPPSLAGPEKPEKQMKGKDKETNETTTEITSSQTYPATACSDSTNRIIPSPTSALGGLPQQDGIGKSSTDVNIDPTLMNSTSASLPTVGPALSGTSSHASPQADIPSSTAGHIGAQLREELTTTPISDMAQIIDVSKGNTLDLHDESQSKAVLHPETVATVSADPEAPHAQPGKPASTSASSGNPKPAPGLLFKPSKTLSELNLFGTEYCQIHSSRRPTKEEVKTAFNALSSSERQRWADERTKQRAAKK